jgi:hypothetical protein
MARIQHIINEPHAISDRTSFACNLFTKSSARVAPLPSSQVERTALEKGTASMALKIFDFILLPVLVTHPTATHPRPPIFAGTTGPMPEAAAGKPYSFS